MIRFIGAVLAMAVLVLGGCETAEQSLVRERRDFGSLQPGLSRLEVMQQVGCPTDRADGFYHYERGPARDAWLYFDHQGRLTQVQWEDEESLRLGWTAQHLHQ